MEFSSKCEVVFTKNGKVTFLNHDNKIYKILIVS